MVQHIKGDKGGWYRQVKLARSLHCLVPFELLNSLNRYALAISKLLVPVLPYFEEKWNTEVFRKRKVISCASLVNTKHTKSTRKPDEVNCKCQLIAVLDQKPQIWGSTHFFSFHAGGHQLELRCKTLTFWDKKNQPKQNSRFQYKRLSRMQHFS